MNDPILLLAVGMPHGYCYLWQPGLIWLHAASDSLIFLAYASIPVTLLWFRRQRQDLPFSWMFVAFAAFIVACGLTHAFAVLNIWVPTWWLSGWVKAATAVASVSTSVALVRIVPLAVALPSPAQLATANQALARSNAALATEIAMRKRVEAELRQAQDELTQRVDQRTRQLNEADKLLGEREAQVQHLQRMEAVGRLAGGVAHDFNNLLTVINGTSAVALKAAPADSPLRQDLETIAHAGDRAAQLTRQLLAFSRRQVLKPQLVNLNDVVGSLDRMLKRILGEDVAVRTVLQADLPAITADPGQLEQVLVNLAVNARDAMPEGGTLTIETAAAQLAGAFVRETLALAPGAYVMVSVSDTGIGMDAVTLASVFEPFFTTKEPGKGTGLGLSTVYGIVQQSGGGIYAYSEPGMGAVFKIYLPVATSHVAGAVSPAAPGGMLQPAHGSTVLIAEDDPAVRGFLTQLLLSEGYRVLAAGSGAEALTCAAAHADAVELLLTDVVMPGMNGRELAERLQQSQPGMRVVFMSGYTDDTVIRTGVLEAGFSFIQKPFTPDALLTQIAEMLQTERS